MNNRIAVEKKPYFFKYKYSQLAKEIKAYDKKAENVIHRICGDKATIQQLKSTPIDQLTEIEKNKLYDYTTHYPAIDTPCIMNNIAHYIEDIDFHIKQRIKKSDSFDYHILTSDNFVVNQKIYNQVASIIEDTFKQWLEEDNLNKLKGPKYKNPKTIEKMKMENLTRQRLLMEELSNIVVKEGYNPDKISEDNPAGLDPDLDELISDESLANHMVYLFYVGHPSYSKSTLWNLVGKQIYQNIYNKTTSYYFPLKDKNGNLEFLYEKYQITKIDIDKEADLIKACPFLRRLDKVRERITEEQSELREAQEKNSENIFVQDLTTQENYDTIINTITDTSKEN